MDTIHVKTPGGWLNDPNGLIYYKGTYHLFYQHFPHATCWGTMHWGHAVSEDLIHWKHLGVALFPTKHYDQNGVFSGSALEIDGKLHLYYTGVNFYSTDPENSLIPLHDTYECAQALITSEDGYTFDNFEDKKLIIPVIYDDEIGNFNHTRDPKVWKENGKYYMVLGSTRKKEMGRLLILTSEDAIHWDVQTVLEDARFGRILECPDLFDLNGQRILIGSPMSIVPPEEGYTNLSMIGSVDFNLSTCEVSNLGDFSLLDYGRDLYAPQTFLDEEGRRTMFAWIRMPEEVKNPWDDRPWRGMMCAPRVIQYTPEEGILYSIHPHIREHLNTPLDKNQSRNFHPNRRESWLMEATLRDGEELNIGGFLVRVTDHTLHTDRSQVFPENAEAASVFSLPASAEEYKLTILAHANLLEIFVDNGRYVLTNAVYDLDDTLSGPIDTIYVSEDEACLML